VSIRSDLIYALRSLLKAKGFVVAVVLTLGLGVGANAAIFSVVQGILFRPLPNRNEDRLVYIRQSAPGLEIANAFFSVPEIQDVRTRSQSLAGVAEFSTLTFTVIGLGEPRQLRAGVVDGGFFEVMGLRPVLGRLINAGDEGPDKPSVAVLTHRFWMAQMGGDPGVIGKSIRIGARSAEVIGVVEPSIPYPTETEIMANVVTSPHHMGAAMNTDRQHRMTEVFGRLKEGATIEAARAELGTIHGAMTSEFKEAYDPASRFGISAVLLRDQITSNARPVMLALLASAALVFIGACANVANLMLARATRRQPELAMRAALGAGRSVLRRMLLVEAMVLAAAGAVAGLVIAAPAVQVLARYAGRFSIRAQDVSLDERMLLAAAVLAVIAAIGFAFLPRLPGGTSSTAAALANARTTGRVRGGQRVFAVAQIAASFVLLVGAGLLLRALLTLQAAEPGFQTTEVLAVNVPSTPLGRTPDQLRAFYEELRRAVGALPGVRGVAVASAVPWRDAGTNPGNDFTFAIEGATAQDGVQPSANFRSVSPGFFATLGIPMLAGRDFNDDDRVTAPRVVIVSRRLAERMFPGQEPVGRSLRWTDKRFGFIGVAAQPRMIVGVAEDISDEAIGVDPGMTVYHPFAQEIGGGRLFVHAAGDPYALVPSLTKVVRGLFADQPVERAATLDDVRADVMAPTRLNTLVIGGFAVVALAIALVGIAGVLAFSVSGRTREFGIRMAIGSKPADVLRGVLSEGAVIAIIGIIVGAIAGVGLTRVVGAFFGNTNPGDPAAIVLASLLMALTAIAASLGPALRASRVDVMEALRAD
jgi:putative ABC transport system permease protein